MTDKKDELSVPENSIMVGLVLVDEDKLGILRLENLTEEITPSEEDLIKSVSLGMIFFLRYGLDTLRKIGEDQMAITSLLNDSLEINYDETVVPFNKNKH